MYLHKLIFNNKDQQKFSKEFKQIDNTKCCIKGHCYVNCSYPKKNYRTSSTLYFHKEAVASEQRICTITGYSGELPRSHPVLVSHESVLLWIQIKETGGTKMTQTEQCDRFISFLEQSIRLTSSQLLHLLCSVNEGFDYQNMKMELLHREAPLYHIPIRQRKWHVHSATPAWYSL